MPGGITDMYEKLCVLSQDEDNTTLNQTKSFLSQGSQTNLEDCVEHTILYLQNSTEDNCTNERLSTKRKFNETDDKSELEKQYSMLEDRLDSLKEENKSYTDSVLKNRLKEKGYFATLKKLIFITELELRFLEEKKHYDSLGKSNKKYIKVPNVTNTKILDTNDPKLIYDELCLFYNNSCYYSTCYRSKFFTQAEYSQEYKTFGNASLIKTITFHDYKNFCCAEINYVVSKSENIEDNTNMTEYIDKELVLFSHKCVEHDYNYTHNNFIRMPTFSSVKNFLRICK